ATASVGGPDWISLRNRGREGLTLRPGQPIVGAIDLGAVTGISVGHRRAWSAQREPACWRPPGRRGRLGGHARSKGRLRAPSPWAWGWARPGAWRRGRVAPGTPGPAVLCPGS